MGKIVRCSCGVEIRAANEGELLEAVRLHARDAHDMELSDEQILAMAEIEQ